MKEVKGIPRVTVKEEPRMAAEYQVPAAATEDWSMSEGTGTGLCWKMTSTNHLLHLSNLGGNADNREKIVEFVKSTEKTKVTKQNYEGKI